MPTYFPFISFVWKHLFLEPYFVRYRGHRGPKTFRGTPQEVVLKFRDWQRGPA